MVLEFTQMRDYIICPVLQKIGLYSAAAQLLLATGME
jgi:hypothetical protein